MSAVVERVLARLDEQSQSTLARLFEFLRIPSVSAQPDHAADCRHAAEWACGQLAAIGFEAKVHETAGHPVVLAHCAGPDSDAPHVLFYGHYDVQPAEPLGAWTSPPFEPQLVEGPNGHRIVARGAVDDKGQVLTWLEALRGWHLSGERMPVRVSVLLEGEEEIGSPSLEAFLVEHADALRADIAVISDTNMWNPETPAITTRLRGLAYTELTVRAASRDLHSGMYGGIALNPIGALSQILGGLHDVRGRVAIEGFYAGVEELDPRQAAEWAALGFDEAALLAGIGLSRAGGERDRPPLERLWARPTAEINGIWGGYQGPGSKTVIAAEAGAKVSFRLVQGQDPDAIVEAFRRFVAQRTPAGVVSEVRCFGAAPGMRLQADSRWVHAAKTALAEEFGRSPVLVGTGGSIPVVEAFKRLLGLDCLMIGFGLEDDQVHGPNEKFEGRCLAAGIRAHARLLSTLAGQAIG